MTPKAPLRRGDVVLVDFPFTGLSRLKLRPALVVARVLGNEATLAFITSQTSVRDAKSDYLIDPSDPEFPVTGLKAASLIRLTRLITLRRELIHRRLGRIGHRTDLAVAAALRYVFDL